MLAAKLRELRKFPGDTNTTKGFERQVEWCLQAELSLKGLVDLGDQDPRMEYEAFCQTTIHSIVNMFPPRIMTKMLYGGLQGKEQLVRTLGVIVDLRRKAHSLLKYGVQE